MQTLAIIFTLWVIVSVIDAIRGKLLFVIKKGRLKIVAIHLLVMVVLLALSIFVMKLQTFDYIEERFSTVELNVREGPDTDYESIGSPLYPGEKIYVIKDSSNWVAFSTNRTDSSIYGWVAKEYTLPQSRYSEWKEEQDSIKEVKNRIAEKKEVAAEKREAEAEKKAEKERLKREAKAEEERKRKQELFGTRGQAWTYMKVFVEDNLLAPSRAEFPFSGTADYQFLNNNTWRIVTHVDAPNTFGAMIRNKIVVELGKLKSGDWRCHYLQIGDKVYIN